MKTFFAVVTLAAVVVGGVSVRAEDLRAVKARMEQRLGQIDQLKAQGAIGENNRGFLEDRGGSGDATAAVAAENSDRNQVYAEIAKKSGASADAVGRQRARRIAAESAAGVWLQKDDGSWYKK
jgi:uncharacterized protein YdbL (DUF1318 family)